MDTDTENKRAWDRVEKDAWNGKRKPNVLPEHFLMPLDMLKKQQGLKNSGSCWRSRGAIKWRSDVVEFVNTVFEHIMAELKRRRAITAAEYKTFMAYNYSVKVLALRKFLGEQRRR